MVFFTVLSLFYIHLQMKIYDLAYEAKRKEHQIQKLRDDNGVNTYHILALKSVSHIGQKLLDQDSQMQFISNDKVYELASSQQADQQILTKNAKPSVGDLALSVQNWFTVATPQAEAKASR